MEQGDDGTLSQRHERRKVRPRTARRAREREMRKIAGNAERRGRRVSPTVEGFEEALRERGHDGVAEALISRHNQRLQRNTEVGNMMQCVMLPLLTSHLPLSAAAEDLGAHAGRFPSHPGRTWLEHLAWGLDSTASAVRLLLSLQPIGASIIARTRWTGGRRTWSSTQG